MAQTIINVGVTANDGSGDAIRQAGIHINNNFTEVYDFLRKNNLSRDSSL